jgi:2,3-bisphosphoglycerate-dependent phosphoglycerate mutase
LTIIGLVRHGVTDWNIEGRMQGKNDIALNEEGRRQAELLGKRMAGESWDYIYSSDMQRARETADIIARHMGMKVEGYDPLLAERAFGLLEGTTEQDRLERWGEGWKDIDHGGEPREDVIRRGMSLLEELDKKHPGKRVLVVSHGAVIGSLLETMFPDFGYIGLKNTCVSIIEKSDRGWDCLLHNCVKHLDAV